MINYATGLCCFIYNNLCRGFSRMTLRHTTFSNIFSLHQCTPIVDSKRNNLDHLKIFLVQCNETLNLIRCLQNWCTFAHPHITAIFTLLTGIVNVFYNDNYIIRVSKILGRFCKTMINFVLYFFNNAGFDCFLLNF